MALLSAARMGKGVLGAAGGVLLLFIYLFLILPHKLPCFSFSSEVGMLLHCNRYDVNLSRRLQKAPKL